ncbi:hypothetical protein ABT061_29110 [Streptosporangium sp. NPDC002544]
MDTKNTQDQITATLAEHTKRLARIEQGIDLLLAHHGIKRPLMEAK